MKRINNIGADIHKDLFSLWVINTATGGFLGESETSLDAKVIKRIIDFIISNKFNLVIVSSLWLLAMNQDVEDILWLEVLLIWKFNADFLLFIS